MLLILRSSAAASRLIGSSGLPRFFSDGTSLARGCRWPIGASRAGWDWLAAPDVPDDPVLLPVCATAIGPPNRTSIAIDMISLPISILHQQSNASTSHDQEPQSLRNCGAPGRRSPEPFVHRPWCQATIFPPRPARQRTQASPHSQRCDCLGRPAAPAPPFLHPSSAHHGFGG